MGDVTISAVWLWVLGAASALSVLKNAWDIIKRWGKGDLTKHMSEVDRQIEADRKRLDALEKGQAITMRALLALINHEIDGNNIEGMKTMRTEISNYLIER